MKFQEMLDLVYAQAEGVPVNQLPCYQGAWDTLEAYTRGDIVVDEEIAWKAKQDIPARLLMRPAVAPDFWKPIRVMNAALLKTVERLLVLRVESEVYVMRKDLATGHSVAERLVRTYTAYTRLPLVDALSVIDSYSDVIVDAFNINSINPVIVSYGEIDDMEDLSIFQAGGFIIENMPKNVEELKLACGAPVQPICPLTHFLLANSVTFAVESCAC